MRTLLKYEKKRGKMRNMRQPHILIKLACLIGTILTVHFRTASSTLVFCDCSVLLALSSCFDRVTQYESSCGRSFSLSRFPDYICLRDHFDNLHIYLNINVEHFDNTSPWFTDWFSKVLRPTQRKIGHFWDVLLSLSLKTVDLLKKL